MAGQKNKKIQYLVFDVESVADGELVAAVRYPNEKLESGEAVRRYRDELVKKSGSDFIPHTFQVPTSIVVGKVTEDFRLVDLVALDEPDFRPHVMTKLFWKGWEAYKHPTLVTFNGRGFDIPLLELAAFRYGLPMAEWIAAEGPNYKNPRYRYNTAAHLDLCEVLTNFGAARFNGGLNLAATMLGKPGKMNVQGHMVQDLYDEGQLDTINDYCRCDVLDTYFVFLRTSVLMGKLGLDEEQAIIQETKSWLENESQRTPAFGVYLTNWGDWHSPWE